MSDQRFPFWVRCVKCSHAWAAAYLPMEVRKFSAIVKGNSTCPMCGAKKPVIARQEHGVLLPDEPAKGGA